MRTARRRLCDGRRTVGKREGGAEAAPFALNNLHLNEGTARQASGMAGRHTQAPRLTCSKICMIPVSQSGSHSGRECISELRMHFFYPQRPSILAMTQSLREFTWNEDKHAVWLIAEKADIRDADADACTNYCGTRLISLPLQLRGIRFPS